MTYVVAWVTVKECSTHWLMVEHQQRGWELPGGIINAGETPAQAAMREVLEETGLTGSLVGLPLVHDGDGFVVHLEVDDKLTVQAWPSLDPAIRRVSWLNKPPDSLAWGLEELKEVSQRFGGPVIT